MVARPRDTLEVGRKPGRRRKLEILDPRKYLPGRERQFEVEGRSILATFTDAGSARQAADDLREAGFAEVQVDEVSWRPAERGSMRDQPWPTSMTGQPDRDTRGLAAQDPSVGGTTRGGTDLIGGYHYLLTVVTPDDRLRPALEIIRSRGGNVDTGGPR